MPGDNWRRRCRCGQPTAPHGAEPGHRDTGTPGHRDTGTPGHRDTGTPGHRDTGTPGHRDTGTPGHRDTGTPGAPGHRDTGTEHARFPQARPRTAADAPRALDDTPAAAPSARCVSDGTSLTMDVREAPPSEWHRRRRTTPLGRSATGEPCFRTPPRGELSEQSGTPRPAWWKASVVRGRSSPGETPRSGTAGDVAGRERPERWGRRSDTPWTQSSRTRRTRAHRLDSASRPMGSAGRSPQRPIRSGGLRSRPEDARGGAGTATTIEQDVSPAINPVDSGGSPSSGAGERHRWRLRSDVTAGTVREMQKGPRRMEREGHSERRWRRDTCGPRRGCGEGQWCGGGGWVFRRCPTLPRPVGRSTIGAGGLSFRVRDGTGRFPSAMSTGTPNHPHLSKRGVLGLWSVDASSSVRYACSACLTDATGPWCCGCWWCVGQVLGLLVPVH